VTANHVRRMTLVWLILILATCASTWCLSSDGGAVVLASVAILAIAGIKVRLIMIHFMELGRAPWRWRLVFEVWVVGVVLAIQAVYLGWVGV
jgi:heme/copper-type cytochrome/quinol oxidase subunit 4